jgi:PAS domain-containing protein
MAKKVGIVLDLTDKTMRERLAHLISDDWTAPWRLQESETHMGSDGFVIRVTDAGIRTKPNPPLAPVIFVGNPTTEEKNRSFSVVPASSEPETVLREIRRAYSHCEILRQNLDSIVPCLDGNEALASLVRSFSTRLNQMVRQSEMRIALVDQLPVGVLGIDDEDHIVLANPKAVEILSVEDIPIWGMQVERLLGREVGEFLADGRERMEITRHDEPIVLSKSRFLLDGAFAGTILVLNRKKES